MNTKKRSAWLTAISLFVPMAFSLIGATPAQAAGVSTALTTFTVEGQNALNSQTINLDVSAIADGSGALAAEVIAVAEDAANTTVTVAGNTGLSVGNNTLTVTVAETADAANTTVFTRTLRVLNNKTEAQILVNQEELVNGEGIEVDWGTTSVPVVVKPVDANATVRVNGNSIALVSGVASTTVTGLDTGENLIDVFVTAENGEQDEAQLTVIVLKNSDTAATFTIDGINAEDGDTVPLDFGTTDPEINVQTNDVNATFEMFGGNDLITGENPLEIYVTAEDGVTFQKYSMLLVVLADNDASATITVNGVVREDGDAVELAYGTTSVAVSVTPTDADASYEITGGTGLLQGDNDLIITVYAPDNVTTIQYAITLTVIDPDVTLSSIKVNGVSVADNGSIISGSLTNTLALVTTDPRATLTVDGGTFNATTGVVTLEPGQNDLTITVTGQDNSTTRDYSITVGVWSVNVEWEGAADPVNVVANSSVIVPGAVTEVTVSTESPLAGWSAIVEGTTGLNFGNNTVTVTFVGPNDEEIQVPFTVFVGDVDLSFEELTVNGDDVTLNGLTGTITLDPHTSSAAVIATPKDPRSTVVVTGGSSLNPGNNSVTVVVTGADGKVATYNITVVVTPSDVADIDAVLLNGAVLTEDDLIEVDAGALDFQVDLTDESATAVVTVSSTPDTAGGWFRTVSGVSRGSGYLTIKVEVTAEDGTTKNSQTFNILASQDINVISGSTPASDVLRVGSYAKTVRSSVTGLFTSGSRISYSWLADGQIISGEALSRYLLTAEDLEREIRPVVTGTSSGVNTSYIGKKLSVSKGLIKTVGTPRISGKTQLGLTLTAQPGNWSKDVEFAYQWKKNGVAISGANSETLDLTAATFSPNDSITVTVTGSLEGYDDASATSAAAVVTQGLLSITDKPTATANPGYVTGATITVSAGSVSSPATVSYSWYRNGVLVPSVTTSSYNVTAADTGKKLSVKVSYSAPKFVGAELTLKLPTIKAGTLATPNAATITKSGNNLYATGGYDVIASSTSVKYTWFRNGAVVIGANTYSYSLSAKDAGAVISVGVAATYSAYLPTTTTTTGSGNYQAGN